MPTLPSSIALTNIADGSPAVAADERNNFNAIQVAMNALITALSGGATGDAILGTGTTITTGPAYATFSPTWASTGTQPVLGNGTITGRYARVGKIIHYSVVLTMGSTTTFGTGSYTISLPVTSNAANGLSVGQSLAFDISAGTITPATANMSGAAINFHYPATWPNGVDTPYGQLAPFTWAVSDVLSVSGVYEAT